MSQKENFIKVKEFLTEDRWTKCAMARNAEGDEVDAEARDAVKFCLMGAIHHIFPTSYESLRVCVAMRDILGEKGYPASITEFNDAVDTTHANVMTLLDKLIEKSE